MRFFHILCIIYLSGYVQPNAYAGNERSYATLIIQSMEAGHSNAGIQEETSPKIQSYPAHIRKIVEFVSGDVEEENETNPSSKKYPDSKANGIISVSHLPSNEYFLPSSRSSLTYFRLSFIPVSRRYILFQVFRI